ncbi:MAG: hypothetical protein ABIF19_06340 [Planctomycetota bacterium]
MKKAKVVSAIVLPVLLIVGTLVVSGHAGKPQPEPEPQPAQISVSGAIQGEGNPCAIKVTLVDPSFGDEGGTFISNPDDPPSFRVEGSPGNIKLIYYYCIAEHEGNPLICNNVAEHDETTNYRCVAIYNGRLDKKTGQILFRAGSRWRLSQNAVPTTVSVGTLDMEVRYTVLEWSS